MAPVMMFLCNTNYDQDRGMAFVRSLIDKRVDGVLIMSSSMSGEWLVELGRNNVPAVVLDWEIQNPQANVTAIRVNFEQGIRAAVDHLVVLGHRHLTHVSGPLRLQTSQLRRDAFLNGLAAHGLPPEAVPVIEGNLQIDGGRRAVPLLLDLAERPTAIFAANDLTAIGILNELRGRGFDVPRDFSLVGLDDIWLAIQVEPPLTTVALPRYEIGRLAMASLLELLQSQEARVADSGRNLVVDAELVIRKSSAMVPVLAH